MKVVFIALSSAFLLSSCIEAGPNFERMTEAELAAYNSNRNLAQMIVCSEASREFSRVRRRRCATVEQMYGSVEQAEQLGVLNATTGIGTANGPL